MRYGLAGLGGGGLYRVSIGRRMSRAQQISSSIGRQTPVTAARSWSSSARTLISHSYTQRWTPACSTMKKWPSGQKVGQAA